MVSLEVGARTSKRTTSWTEVPGFPTNAATEAICVPTQRTITNSDKVNKETRKPIISPVNRNIQPQQHMEPEGGNVILHYSTHMKQTWKSKNCRTEGSSILGGGGLNARWKCEREAVWTPWTLLLVRWRVLIMLTYNVVTTPIYQLLSFTSLLLELRSNIMIQDNLMRIIRTIIIHGLHLQNCSLDLGMIPGCICFNGWRARWRSWC